MARLTLLPAVFVLLTSPALAYWHGDCPCGSGCCESGSELDYCKAIFHINNQWPAQYLCADRLRAHAPFNAMVANGWRRQNLMGSHHFNRDATQLSQAGQLKVQWILTQAPPAYRRMFIERSTDPAITQQRIETVRDYATRVALNEQTPTVEETHIVSEGRPAATVDYINTQFRDNMLPPTLPASTTTGGSQ